MSLAGVDDEHSLLAGLGSSTRSGRFDRRQQQRGVVAELLAEAARQDEVALHVDDDQRRGLGIEVEIERFRLNF